MSVPSKTTLLILLRWQKLRVLGMGLSWEPRQFLSPLRGNTLFSSRLLGRPLLVRLLHPLCRFLGHLRHLGRVPELHGRLRSPLVLLLLACRKFSCLPESIPLRPPVLLPQFPVSRLRVPSARQIDHGFYAQISRASRVQTTK